MNSCKTKYYLIFVLSFGLISCGSDQAPVAAATLSKADDWTVEASFAHADKSIHAFDAIEELPLNSTLQLTENSGPLLQTVAVKSICSISPFPEKFALELNLPATTSIPVTQLLPLQVFTPHNQDQGVFCEFKLAMTNSRGTVFNVLIKKIHVSGFDTFTNFQPFMDMEIEPQEHFKIQELLASSLTGNHQTHRVHLLCDKLQRTLQGHWENKQLVDFFSHEVPNSWGVLNCRIVHEDIGTRNLNHVSPIFKIHETVKPIVLVDHDHYRAKTDKVNLFNSVVLKFYLQNQGKVTNYLKIWHGGKSFIETSAIVYRPGLTLDPNALPRWFGATHKSQIHWRVVGQARIIEAHPSYTIVEVRAGGQFALEGRATLNMDCSAFHSKARICQTGGHLVLHGLLTKYSFLPYIDQNQYNNLERQEFTPTLNIGEAAGLYNYLYDGFNFWEYVKPPAGCIAMGATYRSAPHGTDPGVCK